MSASLVGSEMCIRDSSISLAQCPSVANGTTRRVSQHSRRPQAYAQPPVSYTHLTLPTICSV
eukprot:10180998-Alexandrium_andersonii.AAC.1